MSFHVGQQVVCVDDTGWRVWRELSRPVKGRIYTIRALSLPCLCTDPNELGLLLEEIVNPTRLCLCGPTEDAFFSRRFRPVRKTDISIFTAMLNPSPKEKVDA